MSEPRTLAPLATRTRWVLAVLGAVPFSVALGVVLLADRAPGFIFGWLGRLWRFGSAAQQRMGVDVIDRPDLPLAFDTVGHFGLWFVAGVFTCALAAGKMRLRTMIVWLLAAGAGSEIGQGFLTSSRNVEVSDALANGLGAVAGVVMTGLVLRILALARPVRFASA